MNGLFNNAIRAAKRDVGFYDELVKDPTLMPQSMAMLVLSSLAMGIGFGAWFGPLAILIYALTSVVCWCVWAWLTFIIGVKFFRVPETQCSVGTFFRVIGFSSAPGIICVLGFLPGLGRGIFFVAQIWMLVCMVTAVRIALNYKSTLRSVLVCLTGFLIYLVVMSVLKSV